MLTFYTLVTDTSTTFGRATSGYWRKPYASAAPTPTPDQQPFSLALQLSSRMARNSSPSFQFGQLVLIAIIRPRR